jgi:hypothetical protein
MEAATIPRDAHVYAMRMYSERLQILISKEQRRRLEQEARRRGSSVASVIRDAVEAELGGVSTDDRLSAARAISRMRAIPHLAPEELARQIDLSHSEEIAGGFAEDSPQ